MNHWPFILAAYGVTAVATTVLLIVSWAQMRRAERTAQARRERP